MTHLLSEKAVDCLLFIGLNGSDEPNEQGLFVFAQWQERWDALCAKWGGDKVVVRKLEDLSDKGYIDYGVSARMGWLTDKGIAKLKEFAEAR